METIKSWSLKRKMLMELFDFEIYPDPLRTRSNEARSLLKKCFANYLFSLVPFDLWKIILKYADETSMAFISQTCWGFRELWLIVLNDLVLNDLSLAFKLRKEEKLEDAWRSLYDFAVNGNSLAMFHVGYALLNGGWGVSANKKIAAKWFKKAAKHGSGCGMAFYAYCLLNGTGVERDGNLALTWGKKALSSNNFFAFGFCFYWGVGTGVRLDRAVTNFKVAANGGDEFAQKMLGDCFQTGYGMDVIDDEEAFRWYSKSAEQGLANSMYELGCVLREGQGCVKNEEEATVWFKKALLQENEDAFWDCKRLLNTKPRTLFESDEDDDDEFFLFKK